MPDAGKVWETVAAILLATAGGFARILSAKDTVDMPIRLILSKLFISGFAGLMGFLAARTMGMQGDWIGLVAGIAGWLGVEGLNALAEITMARLGRRGSQ